MGDIAGWRLLFPAKSATLTDKTVVFYANLVELSNKLEIENYRMIFFL
jgi:hypothetical protein